MALQKYALLIVFIISFSFVYAETSSSSINWLSEKHADTLYCRQNGDCNLTSLNVINTTMVNFNVTGNLEVYGNASFYDGFSTTCLHCEDGDTYFHGNGIFAGNATADNIEVMESLIVHGNSTCSGTALACDDAIFVGNPFLCGLTIYTGQRGCRWQWFTGTCVGIATTCEDMPLATCSQQHTCTLTSDAGFTFGAGGFTGNVTFLNNVTIGENLYVGGNINSLNNISAKQVNANTFNGTTATVSNTATAATIKSGVGGLGLDDQGSSYYTYIKQYFGTPYNTGDRNLYLHLNDADRTVSLYGGLTVSGLSVINGSYTPTSTPTFANVTATGYFLGNGSKLSDVVTIINLANNLTDLNNTYLNRNGSNAENMNIGNKNLITTGTINATKFVTAGSTTANNAEFGSFGLQSYAVNNAWLSDNAYYNLGFKYRTTGYITLFYFAGREFQVRIANTGTADNPASTLTTKFKANNNNMFAIGGNISSVTDEYGGATMWGDSNQNVFTNRSLTVEKNLTANQVHIGGNADFPLYITGTTPSVYGTLQNVIKTDYNLSGSYTQYAFDVSARASTGGTSGLYGLNFQVRYTGTQSTTGAITGVQGQIYNTGTGNTLTDAGQYLSTYQATNANASNVYGSWTAGYISDGYNSTITNYRGFVNDGVDAEDGNVTNAYGLFLSPHTKDIGTIISANGIYLSAQNAGKTNWQIYSAGGNSYFAGGGNISANNFFDLTPAFAKSKKEALDEINQISKYTNEKGEVMINHSSLPAIAKGETKEEVKSNCKQVCAEKQCKDDICIEPKCQEECDISWKTIETRSLGGMITVQVDAIQALSDENIVQTDAIQQISDENKMLKDELCDGHQFWEWCKKVFDERQCEFLQPYSWCK